MRSMELMRCELSLLSSPSDTLVRNEAISNSILSVMPAYNGTSIECRSYDECALPEDVDIVDDGVDDGTVEDVDTVDTSAVDELRSYVELMKMKGYILRKREEQRALEMRYGHG